MEMMLPEWALWTAGAFAYFTITVAWGRELMAQDDKYDRAHPVPRGQVGQFTQPWAPFWPFLLAVWILSRPGLWIGRVLAKKYEEVPFLDDEDDEDWEEEVEVEDENYEDQPRVIPCAPENGGPYPVKKTVPTGEFDGVTIEDVPLAYSVVKREDLLKTFPPGFLDMFLESPEFVRMKEPDNNPFLTNGKIDLSKVEAYEKRSESEKRIIESYWGNTFKKKKQFLNDLRKADALAGKDPEKPFDIMADGKDKLHSGKDRDDGGGFLDVLIEDREQYTKSKKETDPKLWGNIFGGAFKELKKRR